jgi:radical SAM-linked protein
LRRAGIPVKFSEGFHPKPRVAFDNPLPTGFESDDERMVITVPCRVSASELLEGLNPQLPEGLAIQRCSESIEPLPACSTFRISPGPSLAESFGSSFVNYDSDQELEISSHKGKLKKIVLKDILKRVHVAGPACVDITLCSEPGQSVRPTEVLKQVFGFSAEDLLHIRFRKLGNRA